MPARKVKKKLIKSPTQARAQSTVEAILEATARVLIRVGYSQMTTNQVAEVAGVSIGSLYQYFPNKDALVMKLIEQQIERDKSFLKQELEGLASLPLEQMIRKLISTATDLLLRGKEVRRVLDEQIPRVGQFQKLREARNHYQILLKPYLINKKASQSRDLDQIIFIAVHAFLGALHAAIYENSCFNSNESRVDLIEELSELILSYLKSAGVS